MKLVEDEIIPLVRSDQDTVSEAAPASRGDEGLLEGVTITDTIFVDGEQSDSDSEVAGQLNILSTDL